jgi:multidrug efflux pump subunit AcrA (membrane-fusion protein)
VQVLVDEQGGQVADDKTETDKSGEPLRARMVLRVPVDSFEDVMNELGSMETLASTSTSSEDVTTQLIDVEARIKAQQASVERVRQLLAQAQSIRDIMAIESELAQRQAELDSLAQQQAYLKDQTSMATVKVSIERKPDPKAPVTKDDSGFLAGLASGWDGLKTTVVAVATVVGALLPFAVVVLLVGVPVWLLVRRMRRTPAPTPAAAPTGE